MNIFFKIDENKINININDIILFTQICKKKQKRKNIRRRQQVLQNLRQWFLPLRNHLNPHP